MVVRVGMVVTGIEVGVGNQIHTDCKSIKYNLSTDLVYHTKFDNVHGLERVALFHNHITALVCYLG